MNPEELKAARLAFLEETIDYYSADPHGRRSVNGARCLYRMEDGRMCAIGRHMPKDRYNGDIEGKSVTNSDVFDLLPDSILNLGVDFLSRVQQLHDDSTAWNEFDRCLTDRGKLRVKYIKESFCLVS